jgi:hypothetical protein
VELVLLTADPELAARAQDAGVDRAMVDLERLGKARRQRGHDLFLSTHTLDDVAALRGVLTTTRLEVRIDPWHERSHAQIEQVLDAGADVVMLPMVESPDAAGAFAAAIDRRASACLLVESVLGLTALPALVAVDAIDEVHLGLNDLMLSRGGRVIFEPLAEGALDDAARLVRRRGLGLGIGGVTAPVTTGLPVDPDLVIAALVRLDVTMGWLGRAFREAVAADGGDVEAHVEAVRAAIARWRAASDDVVAGAHERFQQQVTRWADAVGQGA